MSKYYNLTAVVDGDTKVFHKQLIFSKNVKSSINYMFNYFNKNTLIDAQLEDEFEISKHNIEYVIDYKNRFRVNRVVVA